MLPLKVDSQPTGRSVWHFFIFVSWLTGFGVKSHVTARCGNKSLIANTWLGSRAESEKGIILFLVRLVDGWMVSFCLKKARTRGRYCLGICTVCIRVHFSFHLFRYFCVVHININNLQVLSNAIHATNHLLTCRSPLSCRTTMQQISTEPRWKSQQFCTWK